MANGNNIMNKVGGDRTMRGSVITQISLGCPERTSVHPTVTFIELRSYNKNPAYGRH